MARTNPPDIRTSYTPFERALLAAYLAYPDPAPHELEGIDITKPVDPEEWDEAIQGIAPFAELLREYRDDARERRGENLPRAGGA